MPFIGARLGENFNAAVSDFVILRRKRILIYANFANGGFRRKLARSESVNVKLAAIRTCRRAGQGGEVGLQFVGVIGERVESCSGDDDRSSVVLRAYVNHGGLVGNGDLLLLLFDGEKDIQIGSLVGRDLNSFVFVERETFGHDLERIFSGGEIFQVEDALLIWGGAGGVASGVGEQDRGARDGCV